MPNRFQQTITEPAEISGKGLHSGLAATLRFLPAPAGQGVVFRRIDLPGAPEIPARSENLVHTDLMRHTTLAAGEARVFTIEHLMAATAALGIDNLIVEIDTEEPPFLDGSSLPFVELLTRAGIKVLEAPTTPLVVSRPLAFRDGDAEITALPSDDFRVTFFYSSDEPLLPNQQGDFVITPETFTREIAPARTFCFFHEIEQLRARGLIRGGNLSSSVVIGRKAIINLSLRFEDEPVRHKILDFIGDIALLGRPLQGHFMASKSGHRVHAAFCNFLRKELES